MRTTLLKPRWLLAHVVVVAIAVLFVALGFWQLSRLDERRTFNARLTSRTALPVEQLTRLAQPGTAVDADAIAYRRVVVRGTFDTAREIVLLNRARNDIAGHHLVTPLVTEDGRSLLVDRGWIPYDLDDPPVAPAAPPAGVVEVTGVLFPSQTRGRFGPALAPGGRLEQVFRIDLDRLAGQMPSPLLPVWLLAQGQQPAQAEVPIPVELPRLGQGPHLSYAIQWFAFAAAGLAVYVAVAARRVRETSPQAASAGAEPARPTLPR